MIFILPFDYSARISERISYCKQKLMIDERIKSHHVLMLFEQIDSTKNGIICYAVKEAPLAGYYCNGRYYEYEWKMDKIVDIEPHATAQDIALLESEIFRPFEIPRDIELMSPASLVPIEWYRALEKMKRVL